MAKTPMLPPLWDFATAFYDKPDVQSACLTLQNSAGVNVPLLLCCCWASKYYGVLPDLLAKKLSQLTQSYSQLSIEPLRHIRTTMKHSHNTQWPIDASDWDTLRERVKAIELSAEKLLLQSLERLMIENIGGGKGVECTQEEKATNLKVNVQACLPLIDINQDPTAVCWNTIVEKLILSE